MAVKELLELRVLLQKDDQERQQLQNEKAYLKAAIDQNETWLLNELQSDTMIVRRCYQFARKLDSIYSKVDIARLDSNKLDQVSSKLPFRSTLGQIKSYLTFRSDLINILSAACQSLVKMQRGLLVTPKGSLGVTIQSFANFYRDASNEYSELSDIQSACMNTASSIRGFEIIADQQLSRLLQNLSSNDSILAKYSIIMNQWSSLVFEFESTELQCFACLNRQAIRERDCTVKENIVLGHFLEAQSQFDFFTKQIFERTNVDLKVINCRYLDNESSAKHVDCSMKRLNIRVDIKRDNLHHLSESITHSRTSFHQHDRYYALLAAQKSAYSVNSFKDKMSYLESEVNELNRTYQNIVETINSVQLEMQTCLPDVDLKLKEGMLHKSDLIDLIRKFDRTNSVLRQQEEYSANQIPVLIKFDYEFHRRSNSEQTLTHHLNNVEVIDRTLQNGLFTLGRLEPTISAMMLQNNNIMKLKVVQTKDFYLAKLKRIKSNRILTLRAERMKIHQDLLSDIESFLSGENKRFQINLTGVQSDLHAAKRILVEELKNIGLLKARPELPLHCLRNVK